jgi:hypothetical protein
MSKVTTIRIPDEIQKKLLDILKVDQMIIDEINLTHNFKKVKLTKSDVINKAILLHHEQLKKEGYINE